MKDFDEFLLHASCVGFVIGAVMGLFMGMWCYMTLFWDNAATDFGMIACLVMLGLCVWKVFDMAEKEGKK